MPSNTTPAVATAQMPDILNRSSNAIAAEYRARLAFVRSQPIALQWTYGAELKILRCAFAVVKESEQVRSR